MKGKNKLYLLSLENAQVETGSKSIETLISMLAVRKAGHLNIKTKIFDFVTRVLIGWLANTLASQPIRAKHFYFNVEVPCLS